GVYAALVAFSLILSLIFLIHSKHLQISWPWRLVLFVMFCVMVAGIVFSFTRAAWVSLVLSLLIYFLLRLKVRFAFLLSIGALLGMYLISNWSSINYELTRNKSESDDDLATHVESIGNVSSDPSNLERLNRWDAALEMFRQRPILGWGPGTYTFVYGQHQRSNNMTLISTNAGDVGGVHSEYLRTISESGFLGGFFFLAIVLLAFRMGFNKYHSYEEGLKKYLHLALFLALVTYFSHGVLNNYSDYDKIALPFWGFLSAMVVLENRPKENEG
ncbi:MAG: O-antigen ligase family protein, partial [Bacteroidota bacterium]|nr:O-antigen ligase family protein [Bacteroidota bacterium]